MTLRTRIMWFEYKQPLSLLDWNNRKVADPVLPESGRQTPLTRSSMRSLGSEVLTLGSKAADTQLSSILFS